MASVEKQARRWVAANLITPEQAAALAAFEKERSFFSVGRTFSLIGVFALACGVIAVISANWNLIPDALKLFAAYALAAGEIVWLCRIEGKKPVAFDAGTFFYMLFLMALIGLNSQVFHLVGDGWKAVMFWSVLAFPTLFLTRRPVFGYIWIPIFAGAYAASPYFQSFLEMLKPFGPTVFDFLSFLSFAMFLLIWPIREKAPSLLKPFCSYMMLGTLVSLFIPEVLRREFDGEAEQWTSAFVLVYGAAFIFGLRKTQMFEQETQNVLSAFIGLQILSILFVFPNAFVDFIVREAQLLLLAAFAYFIRQRGLFNFLSVLAGALILYRFLELFGSLLETGVGLIITGVALILAARGWFKMMKVFSVRFKEEKAQ